jgi:hypothetical protein
LLIELRSLWWYLGGFLCSWGKVSRCEVVVCEMRLPLWSLSSLGAKLVFALLTFWSKARLCHVYLGWWIILVLPLVIRLDKYYRFC